MAPRLPTTIGDTQGPSPQRRVQGFDPAGQRIDYGPISQGIDRVASAQMRGIEANKAVAGEVEVAAEMRFKREEADLMADAQRRINESRRKIDAYLYGSDTAPGLYSRKGQAALGSEKEYDEFVSRVQAEAADGLSGKAAEALQADFDKIRTSDRGNLLRHAEQERRGFITGEIEASANIDREKVAREYNNPNTLKTSLDNTTQSASSYALVQGWQPGTSQHDLHVFKERSKTLRTWLDSNIQSGNSANIIKAKGALDEMLIDGELSYEDQQYVRTVLDKVLPDAEANEAFTRYVGGYVPDKEKAYQDIAKFVVDDLENSPDIVPDGDGVARFGINSKANPDLYEATNGFKDLTREMADERIRKKYWEANDIDSLPQNMQAIAFDMYFNGWDPKILGMDVKEAVEAADGNPSVLMDFRREYYQTLVEKNPAKAGDLKGWMNRMTRLEDFLGTANNQAAAYDGTTPPILIDPTRAASAAAALSPESAKKFMEKVETMNKLREQMYDQNVRGFMQQALPALIATGGDVSKLPADMQIVAEKLQVQATIAGYKGEDNPDTLAWWYSLTPSQRKNVDLNAPAVRLGLSPEKWETLTKSQQELKDKPAVEGTEQNRKTIVDNTFAALGLDEGMTADKKGDKYKEYNRRYAVFNELLDTRIQAFRDGNGGRYPDSTELKSMTEELAMAQGPYGKERKTNSFWQPRKTERETIAPYQVRIQDVPAAEQAAIRQALFAAGRTPTNAQIIAVYTDRVNAMELQRINKERGTEFNNLIEAYATIEAEEENEDTGFDWRRNLGHAGLPPKAK
ncbi:MAG: glycosyl hydrolase 108 family protein [Kiritimatiellia bacterium]